MKTKMRTLSPELSSRCVVRRWVQRTLNGLGILSILSCTWTMIFYDYQFYHHDGSFNTNVSPQQSNKLIEPRFKHDAFYSKLYQQQKQKAKTAKEVPLENAREQSVAAAKESNMAWIARRFQLGSKLQQLQEGSQQKQLPKLVIRQPKLPTWATKAANSTSQVCEQKSFLQPSHGCEISRDKTMIFCHFRNLRIDVTKVHCEFGGEPIQDVIGRSAEVENPKYEFGAFTVATKPSKPKNGFNSVSKLRYLEQILSTMNKHPKDLLANVTKPTSLKHDNHHRDTNLPLSLCKETWPGTTMFLTRYEYANLYHTLTDWWNTYFSLPRNKMGQLQLPYSIVFLDGHAQGNLDGTWKQLFGNTTYVKHLPEGGICFEKAIMIPPGYSAPIYPKSVHPNCPNTTLATQFSDYVLEAHGLQNVSYLPGNIVIIDRGPYLAHPRSNLTEIGRMLKNLKDVQGRLLALPNVANVALVRLENMTMKEQLTALRQAHIVIGSHGAGLSHVMFMDKASHVIELASDDRAFFTHLCEWTGMNCTRIAYKENDYLTTSKIDLIASTVSSIID